MKMKAPIALFALSAFLLALVGACDDRQTEYDYGEEAARGNFVGVDGETIGSFTFTQGSGGLLLYVEVESLTPGPHGIHLHRYGACSPDFKAAQGHINPDEKEHGLLNPNGPDNGDLPNLYVAADGTARAEMFTTLVTTELLFDDDGSAVVIHAQPDDHATQPIGGAGDRSACGVIEKP